MARHLVLNVGSSSLKWSVLDHGADARGAVEVSGDALHAALDTLVAQIGPVDAVGHRVVHGGGVFTSAQIVDAAVRRALEELVALDPLHMRPALDVIDAARAAWPGAPHVAAFDTAFHATLPEAARDYAVPDAWRALGVRRYGFHGLSVEHALRRATELLGRVPSRLVVAHLGSGCSVTAVRDGRSVDTTMGMTPLEGLVMGTRSGSIDPGIPLLAMRRLGLDVDACERALTRESGLAGLSGGTSSLRDLRAAAARGDQRAAHACEAFQLSLRRGVGAMIASLGGLDALVFTGGIGERDAATRDDCLAALAFTGLRRGRDPGAPSDRRLDDGAGPVVALVIEAREDLAIGRAMAALA